LAFRHLSYRALSSSEARSGIESISSALAQTKSKALRNASFVKTSSGRSRSVGSSVVGIQRSSLVALSGSKALFIAQAVSNFPGDGPSKEDFEQQIVSISWQNPRSFAMDQSNFTSPERYERFN
jgi:hypothetical protein